MTFRGVKSLQTPLVTGQHLTFIRSSSGTTSRFKRSLSQGKIPQAQTATCHGAAVRTGERASCWLLLWRLWFHTLRGWGPQGQSCCLITSRQAP